MPSFQGFFVECKHTSVCKYLFSTIHLRPNYNIDINYHNDFSDNDGAIYIHRSVSFCQFNSTAFI